MGGSIKLVELLREIGDPEKSSKPYKLETHSDNKYALIYRFETEPTETYSDKKKATVTIPSRTYNIVIGKNRKEIRDPQGLLDPKYSDRELEYFVSFGVIPEEGGMDFDAEFKDTKNLFRIMATVILAINKAIEGAKKPVTRLIIEPTKRDPLDDRRANLYKKYMEKHLPPGWKVTRDDGKIIELERSI